MKTAGIIAECNPLHRGHEYLFAEAKRMTGADYTIAVISGDFVQRGIPAVTDKYTRARQILAAGADLVLELPLYYACGGADCFARGAVALLSKLGIVNDLVFGSESGDIDGMLRTAQALADESPAFREVLRSALKEGLSWPQARNRALESAGIAAVPDAPNDILGTEYCKALLLRGSSISPHAVRRIRTASASELREQLRGGSFLPSAPDPVFEDDFSLPLLWTVNGLAGAGSSPLSGFVDVSDSLSDRILRCRAEFDSWTSFCQMLKSRDLTYTRVSRALLHILLGIKKDHLAQYEQNDLIGYARILGFRKESEPLVRRLSDTAEIPLVASPASDSAALAPLFLRMLQEDFRAALLYDTVVSQKYSGMRLRRIRNDYEQPLIKI